MLKITKAGSVGVGGRLTRQAVVPPPPPGPIPIWPIGNHTSVQWGCCGDPPLSQLASWAVPAPQEESRVGRKEQVECAENASIEGTVGVSSWGKEKGNVQCPNTSKPPNGEILQPFASQPTHKAKSLWPTGIWPSCFGQTRWPRGLPHFQVLV